MLVDKLPEGITMQLYLHRNVPDKLPGKIIFSSSKKWLHPLFDLEEFLTSHTEDGEFFLRDRVVGRAAAFLIVRMEIKNVEADILSRRALSLLKDNSVAIKTIKTVNKIDCATEDLLENISDPEDAYAILIERRTKALNNL